MTSQSIHVDENLEESQNRYLSWLPFLTDRKIMEKLHQSEKGIFSKIGIEYLSKFVSIPFKKSEIYTIQLNSENRPATSSNPIVLIHGFAAGVALWGSLLKRLSKFNDVYAFDLLGFGRSSRPKFSDDAKLAEDELVESIEMWRNEMSINKMNLLGHSFGGFLATSYAIKYPERVDRLILADPWGYNEFNPEFLSKHFTGARSAVFRVVNWFNPLAILRVVGTFGPSVIRKLRPDLKHKYSDDVYEYIYLCNSQKPTGEEAFKCISNYLVWPKHPMTNRFEEINTNIAVTFIHGSRSWIDRTPATKIAEENDHVQCHILEDAGHHVYADSEVEFAEIVLDAVERKEVDE